MYKIIIIILSIILTINNSYAYGITKKGASSYVNQKVQYAYEISGKDKIFIAMLDAENGTWNEYRKSGPYYRKGKKFYDIGICQISSYYHPSIVYNKNFYDWKWQIRKCYEMYRGGVKFYGIKNVYRTIKNFNF